MQEIIACDIDDVLADLMSVWLTKYNLEFSDSLSESDIKTWNISPYTKIGLQMFDYLKDPSIYDKVQPVENSLWGIEKLRLLDYRIIFVTAFNAGLAGRKYQWLKEYNFDVKREDYFECVDKSLIASQYLIDDKIENVENAYGQGIIFHRRWNKDVQCYPRVKDWLDVVNYFDGGIV